MTRSVSLLLRPEQSRGQALVLFALMLIALCGIAALAIDVSFAYSTRRFERSVADAASLAGAQDLQSATSRAVTAAEQVAARGHALDSLVAQLKATGTGPCDPAADVAACALPGTSYLVSVKTPAPSCTGAGTSTCDADHSVQVSVLDPSFQTTFAQVLGQSTWSVGETSVSGMTWSPKYAVITLQPPDLKKNLSDANLCKDLVVSGNGTQLNVLQGDIGTNTSAATTLKGIISLADGFKIYHIDDLTGAAAQCDATNPPDATWSQDANGDPQGAKITTLIQDPAYPYASFTGAPTYATQSAGVTACSGADYPTDWTAELTGAICYKPGVYSAKFTLNQNTDVAYLMPGAYSFPAGMKIGGSLYGGLISSRPGVVLVFPEGQTLLNANNAMNFVLNYGSQGCTFQTSCQASPATDWAGKPVVTPAGLVITIEVRRDGACFSGTNPIISASCSTNQDSTIALAGKGQLAVAGVIYAPSDNVHVAGQTGTTGQVGQIIAWTVTYTGGATLNQTYPGGLSAGLLRIDAACSAPGEPCVSP